MAQEYEVLDFRKGDFQDNHGNYWCDMALKGVGEPVRIVVKDPMKYSSGMTLYGEVKEQTSKAGKEYLRFYREQKPDGQQSFSKPQEKQSDQYWEDRNDAIKAQWALGRSYEKHGATPDALKDAKWLFENANNVVSAEASQPSPQASKQTPEEDKAEDEEIKSFLNEMDSNAPLDMSEIPF